MTIQMPYRKPASRVEANLFRNGEIMYIGSVNLTSGLTPKELNLYGVYNETKIKTSLEKQITRWTNGDNNTNDLNSWALDLHPDFHSAVGAYRAYGICGLSKENDKQYPFFFDLCSQEWSRLSDINTIALFSDGTAIGAIQSFDRDLYGINIISEDLDRSEDYLTSRSDMPQPATMKYKLPEGMKPRNSASSRAHITPEVCCCLLTKEMENGHQSSSVLIRVLQSWMRLKLRD